MSETPEGGGSAGATVDATPATAASTDAGSPPSPETLTPSQVSGTTANDPPPPVDEFAGFGLDEIEVDEPPKAPQPVTGQATEKPAQAAPKEEVKASVEAKPPPTQTQTQQAPQAPPVSQTIPPPSTPEAILQGLEQADTAKQLVDWMSQNVYALSQEEKDGLDTNAMATVPKLLSRVHLEGTKNTLKLISTLVPALVSKGVSDVLQQRERGSEALKEFFDTWPALNAREHTTLVNDFAKLYRASNPSASRQDAIKFVGAAIHAHLNLGLPAAPVVNGAPAPQPVARQRVPAFAPARPGARPIAQVPVDENPWAGLGQDHDSE